MNQKLAIYFAFLCSTSTIYGSDLDICAPTLPPTSDRVVQSSQYETILTPATVTIPAASLRNNANYYYARLSEMAESVTFKDESNTEITEIKINSLPDKDSVIKLSGQIA